VVDGKGRKEEEREKKDGEGGREILQHLLHKNRWHSWRREEKKKVIHSNPLSAERERGKTVQPKPLF
jgi:hypothetical protein